MSAELTNNLPPEEEPKPGNAGDAEASGPGHSDPQAEGPSSPSTDPASSSDASSAEQGAGSESEVSSDNASAPETGDSAGESAETPETPPAKPRRPRMKKPTKPEPTINTEGGGGTGEFQWYVLRVQSGREDTVSNNLRKKLVLHGFQEQVREVAVPKQKVTEIKDGKKRVRAQKVFPGYIFVEMDLGDDLWYLIRDTSGIGDFVGSQAKPVPMEAKDVGQILNIMEEKEEPQEVQIDLVKHDAVKIKEGPFENFDGIVEEVNPARGIVRVMVAIFGRSTPVDLEYWQVEKL